MARMYQGKLATLMLVLIISPILYSFIIYWDLSASQILVSNNMFYPYTVTYKCKGALGTFQFIISYSINYTLRINGPEQVEVTKYSYESNKTFYVPANKVDKETISRLSITRDEFYKILLLDDPSIYFAGRKLVKQLESSTNTLKINIGNRTVDGNYIFYKNYIIVYRGEDVVRLHELGNTTFSVIIANIYEKPETTNEKIEEIISNETYSLTAYFLKYNGLIVRLTYNDEKTGQTLEFKLTDYNNGNTAKYLLLTSLYERIVDIDYGKYILYNTALFFLVVIVWSITIGYFERLKTTRKYLVIYLGAMLISLLATAYLVMIRAPQLLPIYYLSLSIMIYAALATAKKQELDTTSILSLLFMAGLLVLAIYSLLLIIYAPGSLYKLGVEAGVIKPTETSVDEQLLLSRGLNPLLLSKELAYYQIMTSYYIQLIVLTTVIAGIAASIKELIAKKYHNILFLIASISLIILIIPTLRVNSALTIINTSYTRILSDCILSLNLLTRTSIEDIGVLITITLPVSITIYTLLNISFSMKKTQT